MITITNTKTGSTLEIRANHYLGLGDAAHLNGQLSGTYRVTQNGKAVGMDSITRAKADDIVSKARAAGAPVAGEL